MQIIINIPNQALADFYEEDDLEDLKALFSSEELFSNAIFEAVEDLVPASTTISISEFEIFKNILKKKIKENLIKKIDEKLDW